MIVGLGMDIAELDRIRAAWERHGERFALKILTEAEHLDMPRRDPVPYLASRFACKEAAVKALGTGFSQGVSFKDVEIVKNAAGKPGLTLHGRAKEVAHELGAAQAHITLTHGRDTAAAVVVLEK